MSRADNAYTLKEVKRSCPAKLVPYSALMHMQPGCVVDAVYVTRLWGQDQLMGELTRPSPSCQPMDAIILYADDDLSTPWNTSTIARPPALAVAMLNAD